MLWHFSLHGEKGDGREDKEVLQLGNLRGCACCRVESYAKKADSADSKVQKLVEMGFDRDAAARALRVCDGDDSLALEHLLANS